MAEKEKGGGVHLAVPGDQLNVPDPGGSDDETEGSGLRSISKMYFSSLSSSVSYLLVDKYVVKWGENTPNLGKINYTYFAGLKRRWGRLKEWRALTRRRDTCFDSFGKKPTYLKEWSWRLLTIQTFDRIDEATIIIFCKIFFFRYFCDDTSLHGWSYIPRFSLAGSLGWLHRILWFLVSAFRKFEQFLASVLAMSRACF